MSRLSNLDKDVLHVCRTVERLHMTGTTPRDMAVGVACRRSVKDLEGWWMRNAEALGMSRLTLVAQGYLNKSAVRWAPEPRYELTPKGYEAIGSWPAAK